MFRRFLKNRSGATVIEYGLIVAVLSLVIAGGAATVGNSISGMFTSTSDKLDTSVD